MGGSLAAGMMVSLLLPAGLLAQWHCTSLPTLPCQPACPPARPTSALVRPCPALPCQIADKGRLKIAPWDGYLKYYNLGEKVSGHPLLEQMCVLLEGVYEQVVHRCRLGPCMRHGLPAVSSHPAAAPQPP